MPKLPSELPRRCPILRTLLRSVRSVLRCVRSVRRVHSLLRRVRSLLRPVRSLLRPVRSVLRPVRFVLRPAAGCGCVPVARVVLLLLHRCSPVGPTPAASVRIGPMGLVEPSVAFVHVT